MPKLKIQYFAILREQRGTVEETLVTPATTLEELYNELRAQYGFTLPFERIRIAVNDSFVPTHQPLRDGDRIVFIPPVAGG